MAFDPVHFETTLVDIETHLGYLRGNDVAWKYLQQYPVELGSQDDLPGDGEGVITGPVWTDKGYKFPCPDGKYAVTPESVLLGYISSTDPNDFATIVKTVQANVDQAWTNGQAWSTGIADYARSVCDQFTQVDVPRLSEEVRMMQAGVVDKILLNESNDNWAELGSMYTRWSGEHATAFQNFYDNYNDVEARYGRYLSEITTGFAMFAGLAGATQLGAQKFADELLAAIKAQLAQWVAFHGDPGTAASPPPWIADVPGVAEQLLGLATFLPVVGTGAKGVQTGVSGAKQVYALLDKFLGEGDIPAAPKKIPVKTAEEIYTGLTDTLYKDYLTAYQDALDSMNSGASSGSVDAGSLDRQTFSAKNLLQAMNDADTGWEVPVNPGSMAGANDDY
jgi:hypothetical protein